MIKKKNRWNRELDTEEKRFLDKIVIMEDGCWHWNGTRNEDQYGRFIYRITNKKKFVGMAHKFAYLHWIGPVPDGHYVIHKCDTPPCVNPEHLKTGTQKDNMQDMYKKGRNPKRAAGEKQFFSKLKEEDIRYIREAAKNFYTGLDKELAAHFNVTVSTICKVRTYEQWKHIK